MFRRSCHLFCDHWDTEELHKFAKAIGLKREWFQDIKVPHYDLTPSKRITAIEYGAMEVPMRYMANFGDMDAPEEV